MKLSPSEWLEANDIRLWTVRATINTTRKECLAATGVKVLSPKTFKSLRKDHCRWWKKREHAAKFTGTSLDESQWRRIAVWIETNWPDIRNQSERFVVEYMRSSGLPINVKLLAGSATYQRCLRREKESVK